MVRRAIFVPYVLGDRPVGVLGDRSLGGAS